MLYRPFGKTGLSISALGFGAMRLPRKTESGKMVYDHEEGVKLLRQGFDLGINFVDSAPYYCDSESEIIVGKALRDGYRSKVSLSTKLPGDEAGYDKARKRLEQSLRNLQTDSIDFYHLWNASWDRFAEEGIREQVRMALEAKEQGLIRHLSFSSHDSPENIRKLIDTELFETMLCQYNLLDCTNEEAIAYAAEKGLGVVVMGPVGGGRLGAPSPRIQALLPEQIYSSPEIAMRFVLTNPHVCCALSGMGSSAMVEANAAVASKGVPLTPEERERVNRSIAENRELEKLYCTGCNYCMPCPAGVNIPFIFRMMNYHRIYKITEYSREQYAQIGTIPWISGKKASACVECGQCEDKCPQRLRIREQLRESADALEK